MMTAIPLPISFAPEDIGLPRRALDAICIAKITALESVIGTGSAIRWRGTGSAIPAAAPMVAPKRKRASSAKVAMMSGEQFFDARMIACRAVAAEHGEHWHLIEGASQWCAIPPKLRSFVYTSDRGSTKIKCRADARLPAAKYWPEGKLPEGVTVSPDMPRDRTPLRVARTIRAAYELGRLEREYERARKRAADTNTRYHDSRFGRSEGSYWAEGRESDIIAAWTLRRDLREARTLAAELHNMPTTPTHQITRNARAEVMSCEMDYHACTMAMRANRYQRAHDDYNKGQWRQLVQAAWDSRRRLRAARAAIA
jgi:hypothetical protein